MRSFSLIAAGLAAVALSGCVTYPVYQPVPFARLTPEQSAALASRPVYQADRDRYAAANALVQQEDQADLAAQQQAQVLQSYSYAYPGYAGYPNGGYYGAYPGYAGYPYGGYYGAYPYYGGFYPGLSLSFGYRGGYGYRGGNRGDYHGDGGFHGGGGFRGHR